MMTMALGKVLQRESREPARGLGTTAWVPVLPTARVLSLAARGDFP